MKPRPLNRRELRTHPLPPVIDGDKESKGRILVIAGSRNVPGASMLTSIAAMRAGAGQLRIATVSSVAAQIGVAMPEALVAGMVEDERGGFAARSVKALGEQAGKVDAVVAGPGLERNAACTLIAKALLATRVRIALDAALLHALEPARRDRSSLPVLLPHAGELAALLECDEQSIERDPLGCGLRAAEHYRCIVLVKGVASHVVTPEGDAWMYEGGAPGLGVSGSGDILAGIVGGLLARGAEPLDALLWAVWLHGQAGALLARKIAPIGFLAREIADQIPGLLPR